MAFPSSSRLLDFALCFFKTSLCAEAHGLRGSSARAWMINYLLSIIVIRYKQFGKRSLKLEWRRLAATAAGHGRGWRRPWRWSPRPTRQTLSRHTESLPEGSPNRKRAAGADGLDRWRVGVGNSSLTSPPGLPKAPKAASGSEPAARQACVHSGSHWVPDGGKQAGKPGAERTCRDGVGAGKAHWWPISSHLVSNPSSSGRLGDSAPARPDGV